MNRTRASGRTVGGLRTLSLQAPAVTLLLLWMIVPLGMTIWFSFQRYNLLMPDMTGFAGLENYEYLLTDPALWSAMGTTLLLVGWVLVITVVGGTLLAVLFQQDFAGRGIARVLAISPFFVMPTVSALVWKNMMMHPSNGVLAWLAQSLGLPALDWFSSLPLTSIIIIVSWQWLPFALLILLTAMQSLDEDQVEAARMDGAGPLAIFFFITLPHLKRAISVVIMIEMIFLLTIFAEIFVTTSGGPGLATTNLAYLIYIQALLDFDVGMASAGGVIAIILANIVAIFLVRMVAKNLED
ncbi:carbohydrate ABC transporter permease [Vreelandella lutescens]|uniref:ABC transporter permease n=1 Tax=Vreelandella lutescens TaxID=1602943 RepID=A0ABQ1NJ12_9GAMM|nr:sugar ABC transporter permease [Halomonas lutescens]GGC78444.1 ABC transporter permease [Halomonas lutescens]